MVSVVGFAVENPCKGYEGLCVSSQANKRRRNEFMRRLAWNRFCLVNREEVHLAHNGLTFGAHGEADKVIGIGAQGGVAID